MTDLLRLVEDLIPLVDAPTTQAVETLQKIFGAPKLLEAPAVQGKRSSQPFAWPKAGVVITPGVTEGTNTISIYIDGVDGFEPFKGSYSGDRAIPMDRREVRDSLGDPTAARTNPRLSLNRIFGARQQPEWDRYDEADRVIHFEYDASRRVKRITLTAAPAVSD